jgi:hypothetical protein
MNPDVGGDAAGLAAITFPGSLIPSPPGCDVRQIDIVFVLFSLFINLLFQLDDDRMNAKLQDVVNSSSGLGFDFGQRIEVPYSLKVSWA